MELGLIMTISCVMTTIAMIILVGVIAFFARFGGQGVKMLFDRFLGGGNKNKEQNNPARQGQTAQANIASSQSLRQRAQQLDFPAPAQVAASAPFGAQAAAQGLGANNYPDFPAPQFQQTQQASLRPHGQYPEFNPQASQPGQTGGFQASTPSLSPSRPFQAGSQFNPNQQQTQQFGQQPNQLGQSQQFGQQPNQLGQSQQFGQQPYPQNPQQGQQPNQLGQPQQPLRPRQQPNQLGQPQQFGQQQQPNQLGQGQQPLRPRQQPNQLGQQQQFGQQPPNQLGQQQQGFNAQGANPQVNPQQGGLGQNRPPLRSLPRSGDATQYDGPIGRRDSRKGDDHDRIYDDEGRGGNFIDDVGGFIDNI